MNTKTYFFDHISTGEFVAAKHGERGYYQTTIYDLGHCTVMNARQGHSAADVKAAEACSILGNWENFDSIRASFEARQVHFRANMRVLVTGKLEGKPVEMAGLVADLNDGLCTVRSSDDGTFIGIFSYLDGQGLNKAEGLTISPLGD